MKKLSEYTNLDEAKEALKNLIYKAEQERTLFKLKDKIIISNLVHNLDVLLNYETSKGRDVK